jgi:hypothetical protein
MTKIVWKLLMKYARSSSATGKSYKASDTSHVPPAVPSERHRSRNTPSRAVAKYIAPPAETNADGLADEKGPGARSLTSAVPPGVPSVRQSSRPSDGVVAAK